MFFDTINLQGIKNSPCALVELTMFFVILFNNGEWNTISRELIRRNHD
jgi:hypothetical protein